MAWDDFDFGDSSPRVRRQFGDLFDPGDPNPRYESDQFARGQDFGVKPISFRDYATPPEPSPYERYNAGMKDLYGTHPALDAYSQYLKQAPRPEDYRPSKWERLAAGLSGAAAGFRDPGKGIGVALGLNRSRYTTAMEDYQNMAKPMAEAANLERLGISDRAKYIMDTNDLLYKQQQLARQQNVDRETAAWHNRTATTQELGVRGNLQYQTKRMANEDRNFNSLSAYQQQALQNQRAGIGVAQQNADTAARNEMTNWFRAANPPQHQVTAQDLNAAEIGAMSDLIATHPELIGRDLQGNVNLLPPPAVNTPEYQRYQQGKIQLEQEIQRRAHGQFSLGGGVNFGGNAIPDPSLYGDYTDLGPEEQ